MCVLHANNTGNAPTTQTVTPKFDPFQCTIGSTLQNLIITCKKKKNSKVLNH